jgi:general secretion pathway protein J
MNRRRVAGVTLLELLVALAVFAVIGVAAYTALFAVLDARSATERQSQRLAAVQRTVGALTDDLRQIVDRPVRAIQPAQRAPVLAQPGQRALIEFTRGGWPNPAGLARSTLARVQWTLEDGTLRRTAQARPDAQRTSEPPRRVYLEDVAAAELRFLAPGGDWRDQWPPLNTGPEGPTMPQAIEVTLELDDWGEIRRLIAPAPGGGAGPTDAGGDATANDG